MVDLSQSVKNISKQEAKLVVRDAQDYHEALRRNGYYMCPLKDPLCTVEFMKEVRAGVVFCPKASNIVGNPCV